MFLVLTKKTKRRFPRGGSKHVLLLSPHRISLRSDLILFFHLHLGLPRGLFIRISNNFICMFRIFLAFYMPHPSYPPRFYHLDTVWCRIQIMNLHIMLFSSASYKFLSAVFTDTYYLLLPEAIDQFSHA